MRPDPNDRNSSMSCSSAWRADVAGLLVGLLLVFVVASSVALAQSPEQEAALAEAKRLSEQGAALYRAERFSEAEPLLQRSLAIRERVLGPEHPDVGENLTKLAFLHYARGEYAQAEQLGLRALAIREKTLGAEHPYVAEGLVHMAGLYYKNQQYAKAEPLYERALAIQEKVLGPTHPDTMKTRDYLAEVYRMRGNYAKAESLSWRALAILETTLGPEHPQLVESLITLAHFLSEQGLHAKAEPLYRRALAIREKALGSGHIDVAASLEHLAAFYQGQQKYPQAEPLYQRALAIKEKLLGPSHIDLVSSINDLARNHADQGNYVEAERVYQRALAIREKTLGPEHPDVAYSLHNLAHVYQAQKKYAQAEPLLLRALAIREKALGPEHPYVVADAASLALFYQAQGRSVQAEPFSRRARKVLDKDLGPDPTIEAELAQLEKQMLGSLAVVEKAFGPEHPDVASILDSYGSALWIMRQPAKARPVYERARRLWLAIGRGNADLDDETLRNILSRGQSGLRDYIRLLAAIARNPKIDPNSASAALDAFLVAEQLRGGAAQLALTRAGTRAAVGDPASAQLARKVQDLRVRREKVRNELTMEYGKAAAPGAGRLASLQQPAQQVDRDLAETTDRLLKAFPKYAELASPEPIDVASVKQMLREDEALVNYFTLDDRLLTWLVKKHKEPVYRDIPIKRADFVKLVTRVRTSLDQSVNPDLPTGRLAPFDVSGAHHLFKLMVEPLQEHLAGVKHLIFVPDEVSLPIPFGALVTRAEGEEYKNLANLYARKLSPSPAEMTDYAKLSWLARDYTITVLPSATSLRALRQIPRPKTSDVEPLIAFGDPALQGGGRLRGGTMLASRGVSVQVDAIRKMDRLPGTSEELLAVAKAVGADPSKALYLGERATKPTVMNLNRSGRLGKAQVISFATHGLIGGEVKGLKEPALVLTPPEKPNEQDDGLLSLEDILSLKLDNSDWLILSACNTAAPGGSGEGLSGLVRAFFFAGAPSLLVSHWSVDDRATQALMTEVFQRYAKDKTMPRSEALRQGMLALMEKAEGQAAYFAHPFAWAPFFLVGEGAGGN